MSYFELIDVRMSGSEKEQPVHSIRKKLNSFARLQTHGKYKEKTPGFFPKTYNSDKCQKNL